MIEPMRSNMDARSVGVHSNLVLLVRILLRILSQRFDDRDNRSIPIVLIEWNLL